MEADESKVVKVLDTVKELYRLSEVNKNMVKEIHEILSTKVFIPEGLYSLRSDVRVEISKYPRGSLIDNDIELVDCEECELVFDGLTIAVYGREPQSSLKKELLYFPLNKFDLRDLLMLYYIEVGNEGCLDALVNEMVKQNEKLASWLETLKKVLALVKVALT